VPPILEQLLGISGKLVVVFDVVVLAAMLTTAVNMFFGMLGLVFDRVEERGKLEPRESRVEKKAFEHYGRTGTDPAALEADVAALEEVVTKALEPERALGFTPRNLARVKQYSREQIRKELQRLDAGSERFSEDETNWWRALAEEHERLTELVRKPVEMWRVAADNGWRIKRLNVTRDEYRDLERALGGDPDALLGCEVAVVTYEPRSQGEDDGSLDDDDQAAGLRRASAHVYWEPTFPNLDRRRY
jgi:hypothetical protein